MSARDREGRDPLEELIVSSPEATPRPPSWNARGRAIDVLPPSVPWPPLRRHGDTTLVPPPITLRDRALDQLLTGGWRLSARLEDLASRGVEALDRSASAAIDVLDRVILDLEAREHDRRRRR